jgi:AbrB family looped-hinge helix DNA binding protein
MLKARISSRGRMLVPKAVREQLGWGEGAGLIVCVKGDEVILRKAPSRSWRAWEGSLQGSGLLALWARSRREELARDRARP